MSGKDKNRNDQASDFLRYHDDKMRDKERNDFERNLQKDPFASEASEGFESIDPSRAKNDLLRIRKQLKKRTSGKPKMVWYSIAASVAVLMILSAIFIFVRNEKPSEQISYSPIPRVSKDIQVSKTEEKPEVTAGIKEPEALSKEKNKTEPPEAQKYEAKPGRQPDVRKEDVSEISPEAIIVAQAEKPDQVKAAEGLLVQKPVMAKRTSGLFSIVRGRILSAEDNQPLPGAFVTVKGTDKGTITDAGGNFNLGAEDAGNKMLVANYVGMVTKEFKAVEDSSLVIKLEPSIAALNEIVVVGYGGKASDNEQDDELTGYMPPRPENGKADFEKYIWENIRRPDTATAGQRVVVVLNFRVDMNGRIDSIKVIRSPGKIFSDEALRLIKEGPAWKPAEENGKVINDEVRVRIVFK
jgi:TonB family protein